MVRSPTTKPTSGLSSSDANRLLALHGPNSLPEGKSYNMWRVVKEVIQEPMFIFLLVTGSLYFLLGDRAEGGLLFGCILLIIGITLYQTNKTERALQALKDLSSPRALVIRDGQRVRIAGHAVVPGDLLVLYEGDRIPADARVLENTNLSLDESLLTGESIPVRKTKWDGTEAMERPGGEDRPFVYSGTMILQGQGLAEVIATGENTQLGRIGRMLDAIVDEPTRLQREIGRLIAIIATVGLALCILVVTVLTWMNDSFLEALLYGLSMAMSMLPEEFAVVLTVFMALGAWRLGRHRVLTRKVSAIEALGTCTVLCTDKTGTLTENRMTVHVVWAGGELRTMAEDDWSENHVSVLTTAGWASPPAPSDPMEKALLEACGTKGGIAQPSRLTREYPLTPRRLALTRAYPKGPKGNFQVCMKGAPETVLDFCNMTVQERKATDHEVKKMARHGLRVLAVAEALSREELHQDDPSGLRFQFRGLIGLADPVRKEVPEAVAACHRAGIRVAMITGDYPETARSIARQIDLPRPDEVLTGRDLEELPEKELAERIRVTSVFARILPEQKLRIVELLQRQGEVVAMTGDGVNDVPALKRAQIGIAMGERGSDVAREASALVLLDDRFDSIVGAIRMGRRIFANLEKAMDYILAVHIPLAGLTALPVLIGGMPMLLWPIHIVFMELVIDPACSLLFEVQPSEKDLMTRPPRNASDTFFGRGDVVVSIFKGLSLLGIVLAVYGISVWLGFYEDQIRTTTFMTLVLANLSMILTDLSRTQYIFQILRKPHPLLYGIPLFNLILLTLVILLPGLNNLFEFAPLEWPMIGLASAAGLVAVTWFEMIKVLGMYPREAQ
ncbi:MAG: cation-translocating P-type ATPase [Saprospiraceae bacterium]|nr:cation-translocating P-type ATPase [Saprospiraceae bacterium]